MTLITSYPVRLPCPCCDAALIHPRPFSHVKHFCRAVTWRQDEARQEAFHLNEVSFFHQARSVSSDGRDKKEFGDYAVWRDTSLVFPPVGRYWAAWRVGSSASCLNSLCASSIMVASSCRSVYILLENFHTQIVFLFKLLTRGGTWSPEYRSSTQYQASCWVSHAWKVTGINLKVGANSGFQVFVKSRWRQEKIVWLLKFGNASFTL